MKAVNSKNTILIMKLDSEKSNRVVGVKTPVKIVNQAFDYIKSNWKKSKG